MDSGASVSQQAASLRESAGSAANDLTSAVKGGWSSASEVVEAQPLLLGLLGVAVGAALGVVLPRTEAEDKLLGEAADAATKRLGDLGREAAEVAGEHLQGATDALSDGYAKVKEHLDEGSLSGAGEALGEALTSSAKAAGEAATGLADEAKDRLGKKEEPGEERRG